jgi:hypothetical protein
LAGHLWIAAVESHVRARQRGKVDDFGRSLDVGAAADQHLDHVMTIGRRREHQGGEPSRRFRGVRIDPSVQ